MIDSLPCRRNFIKGEPLQVHSNGFSFFDLTLKMARTPQIMIISFICILVKRRHFTSRNAYQSIKFTLTWMWRRGVPINEFQKQTFLITNDLVHYKSQAIQKIHANLGLGTCVLLGFTVPSFWIQWGIPFLWSWQVKFCTRFKVPSWAREDSNCSNTFTICLNSGLFSGCSDQHWLIRAPMAGGQSLGITGLEFWKDIRVIKC